MYTPRPPADSPPWDSSRRPSPGGSGPGRGNRRTPPPWAGPGGPPPSPSGAWTCCPPAGERTAPGNPRAGTGRRRFEAAFRHAGG